MDKDSKKKVKNLIEADVFITSNELGVSEEDPEFELKANEKIALFQDEMTPFVEIILSSLSNSESIIDFTTELGRSLDIEMENIGFTIIENDKANQDREISYVLEDTQSGGDIVTKRVYFGFHAFKNSDEIKGVPLLRGLITENNILFIIGILGETICSFYIGNKKVKTPNDIVKEIINQNK